MTENRADADTTTTTLMAVFNAPPFLFVKTHQGAAFLLAEASRKKDIASQLANMAMQRARKRSSQDFDTGAKNKDTPPLSTDQTVQSDAVLSSPRATPLTGPSATGNRAPTNVAPAAPVLSVSSGKGRVPPPVPPKPSKPLTSSMAEVEEQQTEQQQQAGAKTIVQQHHAALNAVLQQQRASLSIADADSKDSGCSVVGEDVGSVSSRGAAGCVSNPTRAKPNQTTQLNNANSATLSSKHTHYHDQTNNHAHHHHQACYTSYTHSATHSITINDNIHTSSCVSCI